MVKIPPQHILEGNNPIVGEQGEDAPLSEGPSCMERIQEVSNGALAQISEIPPSAMLHVYEVIEPYPSLMPTHLFSIEQIRGLGSKFQSMNSKLLEAIFYDWQLSEEEHSARLALLSPKDWDHLLATAEFEMVHRISNEERAALDLRKLHSRQLQELFPGEGVSVRHVRAERPCLGVSNQKYCMESARMFTAGQREAVLDLLSPSAQRWLTEPSYLYSDAQRKELSLRDLNAEQMHDVFFSENVSDEEVARRLEALSLEDYEYVLYKTELEMVHRLTLAQWIDLDLARIHPSQLARLFPSGHSDSSFARIPNSNGTLYSDETGVKVIDSEKYCLESAAMFSSKQLRSIEDKLSGRAQSTVRKYLASLA